VPAPAFGLHEIFCLPKNVPRHILNLLSWLYPSGYSDEFGPHRLFGTRSGFAAQPAAAPGPEGLLHS
jgi:hypothetical protein